MNGAICKYLEEHGFGTFAPKAVLFDMDGVLYDSMPNHAVAWVESMRKFGITMTKADAYATEGARGIDTIRHFVKEQKGVDITLEEAQKMYDEKTRIFHEMPVAPIFEGVQELMRRIAAAGMTVNVVTGSGQRPLINRLLDDFGTYLDERHIVTAYDVKRGISWDCKRPATCSLGRPSSWRMRRLACVPAWRQASLPWRSTAGHYPMRPCLRRVPICFIRISGNWQPTGTD